MKKLATALGLAEEASEDSILAALTKLKNRVTELEPLSEENTKLKNRVKQIDVDAIAALLDARGVKDEKVKNRLTSLLVPMPTLEERTACLDEFGFKAETKAGTARVLNRGSASSSAADPTAAEADDAEVAKKIMNRAHELKGASTSRTFDSCWNQARAEIVKPTK